LIYFGSFFGYIICSIFADNFGRKFTITLTWLVAILGFLLTSMSWHISVVGIGLFLAGTGAIATLNTTFLFLSEVV
jgi:MFS family permease